MQPVSCRSKTGQISRMGGTWRVHGAAPRSIPKKRLPPHLLPVEEQLPFPKSASGPVIGCKFNDIDGSFVDNRRLHLSCEGCTKHKPLGPASLQGSTIAPFANPIMKRKLSGHETRTTIESGSASPSHSRRVRQTRQSPVAHKVSAVSRADHFCPHLRHAPYHASQRPGADATGD